MAKYTDTLRDEVQPPISKTRITIMLDDDVLAHFRTVARKEGGGYQTRINSALRASLARSQKRKQDEPVTASELKKVLKKVVRDELRKR